ncbi:MAG: hypothetical protein F2667_01565 [Actinobacteria bacterium]|uniref:Unannotated protein n=1 Tax=freshwater metagenome TaxID=449393 RepID=A0A6J6NWZ4_9ZZZZ|nr:hypothetical protein [Actinomycetota bacterium]
MTHIARLALVGLLAPAALVPLVASPSTAAGATIVRVDGNRFGPADLEAVRLDCTDTTVTPEGTPVFRSVQGPGEAPLGYRSSGWLMKDTTGAVGPIAHVPDPTTTSKITTAVYSTSVVEGLAFARYHAPDDTGVWRGTAEIVSDNPKKWTRIDATELSFSWRHFSAEGVEDAETGGARLATLAAFTEGNGGNGDGAEVGFLFGCNSAAFLMDDMRITTAKTDRRFDLEGFKTVSSMSIADRSITIGDQLKISGSATSDFGSLAGAAVALEAQRAGRGVKQIATGRLDDQGTVTFTRRPSGSGAYRLRVLGTDDLQSSSSDWVNFTVRYAVSARSTASRVASGNAFAVSGKVSPRGRTAVRVQRKTGGSWSIVTSGSSSKSGGFSIAVPTNATGRQQYRVLVPGNRQNSAATSRTFSVTVTSGGGGGGVVNPPTGPHRIVG